jgi:hypothetical protein
MSQPEVVQQWLDLPHRALVDQVHHLVRSHDETAYRCWSTVREHPVLAARVRGILSALERHSAEYRDAAMWRVWIAQARKALTPPAPPSSHAAPPARDTITTDKDHVSRCVKQPSPNTMSPAPVTFQEPGQ